MQDTTLDLNSLSSSRPALKSAASTQKPRFVFALLALLALFGLALISTASAQQNNTIGTVAGPGPAFNSVALDTFLPNPTGIAEDSKGNLYIAAKYSYYIYKLTPSSGAMSIVAGTGIAGPSNGGDGGPATAATLNSAVAVAVDASGNLYIADANRLRVVNNQSSAITVLGTTIQPGDIDTVAGSTPCSNAGTIYPSCGDTGPASQAQFYGPQGIYIDGSGNIFIADTTDQEIRFINMGASTVNLLGVPNGVPSQGIVTVAGNGYICNTPATPCGDGGPATVQGAHGTKLDIPIGLITDRAGNLYIGDTRDQRIRCVANVAGGCPQTAFPSTVVGEIVTYAGRGAPYCTNPTGNTCDGLKLKATFHNPSGIWLDPAGNLYVADQWDNKIREVTTGANGKVESICGTGTAGWQDGKCPGGVEFYGPTAIIIDSAGNAFIADSGNDYIREGNAKTLLVKTVAGTGVVNPGPNGVTATSATLANPVDVKWDSTGTNYYISDNGNNVIWKVSTTTGMASVVAGSGHPTQWQTDGDSGPATSATLDDPNGIALDAQGNLYIADSTDSIVRVVNMQSAQINVATVPVGPGDIQTIAGSLGSECLSGNMACGDGGLATQANVDYPIAVSVDAQGNIYVPDYFFSKIRCVANVAGACPNTEKVNGNYLPPLNPGQIATIAGIGGPSYNGNGILANVARLAYPYGLSVPNGALIFDDSGNNMVRCVATVANACGNNTKQNYIYEYALTGAAGFSGDGQSAKLATESIPQGFDFDPAGTLYIGGGADLVVRRIDVTTGNIMTVAGDPSRPGAAGFAGDGGPSTSATLDNIGLAVNGNQQLVIADTGNNRVRQVDMVPELAQFEKNINFGTIPVGQNSQSMPATIQNYGLATLPLGTTQLSDTTDFTITSNTCMNQLPPGPQSGQYKSTCTVQVQFNPKSQGNFNAPLTINTSLGAVTFNLIGTGQ